MLSSGPASCTSPNPGTDNPDKKVHWASEKRRRASSTDSESKTHLDISKLPRSRRPSRLTVKYDRGHLQRWLEMEQWIDAQVQELFQVGSLRGLLEGWRADLTCSHGACFFRWKQSLNHRFNPFVRWKRPDFIYGNSLHSVSELYNGATHA